MFPSFGLNVIPSFPNSTLLPSPATNFLVLTSSRFFSLLDNLTVKSFPSDSTNIFPLALVKSLLLSVPSPFIAKLCPSVLCIALPLLAINPRPACARACRSALLATLPRLFLSTSFNSPLSPVIASIALSLSIALSPSKPRLLAILFKVVGFVVSPLALTTLSSGFGTSVALSSLLPSGFTSFALYYLP